MAHSSIKETPVGADFAVRFVGAIQRREWAVLERCMTALETRGMRYADVFAYVRYLLPEMGEAAWDEIMYEHDMRSSGGA